MASVQFQPTIENFGDLNLRATHVASTARKPGVSLERHRATTHFLAGFVFILGFMTCLSALYVADQALFASSHMTADVSDMSVDYN